LIRKWRHRKKRINKEDVQKAYLGLKGKMFGPTNPRELPVPVK
jgi:hypothetical protein